MATLSTHVLDTASAGPPSGIRVALESARAATLGEGVTDADGRIAPFGPSGWRRATTGCGSTPARTSAVGVTGFYPEVVVTFTVEGDEHYHVPLLLSPYGYSTYRGS